MQKRATRCGAKRLVLLLTIVVVANLVGVAAGAGSQAAADVVVIVDTSTSMQEPGMDPQWASLLVSKLLADIVPGELAVVRLLDLVADGDVLPNRKTGESQPCAEDPTRQCAVVEPASDWHADARAQRLGALIRPARGDEAFKQQLEQHLERRINNSAFSLAFAACQGVFDEHRSSGQIEVPQTGVPRTVIWLSDGRAVDPPMVVRIIHELQRDGVAVEAIVFGQGDTSLARQAGLRPSQVSSPGEIMGAFADAFRQVVQAPYRIDHQVAVTPVFEMKPHVDEAWVVVYGDDTLGAVTLTGPDGPVAADYAAERWQGAGAYRVAYLRRPAAGRWQVSATGGGPGVAYAVVQRSALTPALLSPLQTTAGVRVPLVAGVRAGLDGELINEPELLAELHLTAEIDGSTVTLRDDGTAGDTAARDTAARDAAAGDGRFTAPVTFQKAGQSLVILHLEGPVVDRRVRAMVEVTGLFRYTGGPVELDLGTLGVDSTACRDLPLAAEHQGKIPFTLGLLQTLPSGHQLLLRAAGQTLLPEEKTLELGPDDRCQVCLESSATAPSSTASGEPWLRLQVAGSQQAEQQVEIRLRWQVNGLGFWQRWGWLILTVLGALLLLVVIAGYVTPHRFSGSLALSFVPSRDELDEQTPQPVKQWHGVGIGFYRNARAFLQADFRLSGTPTGALAGLEAVRGGTTVQPGKGQPLWRETLDGDWEAVPAAGRRARPGDVYRVGEQGPFFRIASNRGK